MKVATWNVNGIRARQGQLLEWCAKEQPDVLCLQEVKASIDQLGWELREHADYWTHWHGEKGYSGVALWVKRSFLATAPEVVHPPFDFEQRMSTAAIATPFGEVTVASIYVPNGGKDYEAKLTFLKALSVFAREQRDAGHALLLCGDLNLARSDMDIHEKERKANQVGARPDERAVFEEMLTHDLIDVGRTMDPNNADLFTWWAPWRNFRQRNIGWRIDYQLASPKIAATCKSIVVQREIGTSDHGPVVAIYEP